MFFEIPIGEEQMQLTSIESEQRAAAAVAAADERDERELAHRSTATNEARVRAREGEQVGINTFIFGFYHILYHPCIYLI